MGKRVLIIEDDPHISRMLETALNTWGYATATAEDGIVGLARIEDYHPHLIVLDLVMPNLNGFEMLQEFHKRNLPPVPFIVMTGFTDRFNEKILRDDPLVLDCQHKPLDIPALARLIETALAETPTVAEIAGLS